MSSTFRLRVLLMLLCIEGGRHMIIGVLNTTLYLLGYVPDERYEWARLPIATFCFALAEILWRLRSPR